MRVLAGLRPLRSSPPFRRLWVGTTLSAMGGALTTFAVPLQIWDLTRSSLAVGGLGVAELAPLLTVGLFGGHLADAVDRCRLLLVTRVVRVATSAALAAQAFGGSHLVWLLYGLVALQSAAGVLGAPASQAVVTGLLAGDQLAAGLALRRVTFQLMLIVGPAVGGLVAGVPALGLRTCYLVDTVSFAASFWGIVGLPVPPPRAARPGARGVADGLRLVARRQPLAGALLADLAATVLALPVVLFPAINSARFGGDPRTLGLLSAAIGVGGLLTAACSAPFTRAVHQGRVILAAVAVWGAAFAGFAVVRDIGPTLALLALAGAADTVTVVLRGAVVQANAPDELRGRVSAAEYVVGGGGGQLGNVASGALASVTSPATSALAGGLATVVAVGAIAAALPGFRRYRAATAPAPSPV